MMITIIFIPNYHKHPNKHPGRLLRCLVSEEGEGAFIKAIYTLGWFIDA